MVKVGVDSSGAEIMKFSNSRKIYVPFYFMSLVLLGIIFYFYSKGEPVSRLGLILVLLFIVLGIKFTELHRFRNSYEINPEFFMHRIGIISRRTETIDLLTISHIDIIQNIWQRLLNYGDVNVRVFSIDNLKPVKGVNDPYGLVRFLEKMMDQKRKGEGPNPSPAPSKTYHKRIR